MFPYGAIPFYWVFGRCRFKGYAALAVQFANIQKEVLEIASDEYRKSASTPNTLTLKNVFEKLAETPFLGGNAELRKKNTSP